MIESRRNEFGEGLGMQYSGQNTFGTYITSLEFILCGPKPNRRMGQIGENDKGRPHASS